MTPAKEKKIDFFDVMKADFGYINRMQVPTVRKVVVSVGVGSLKDKKKLELVADRLTKITGQKPAKRGAKKSIASFKVRQGDPVGFQITLRGPKMNGFLAKLLNVAFPRTRDFRGIPRTSVDEMGNMSIGIKEHTIFPETADEDIKDVFGMAVTVVSSAKSKKEAERYFAIMGFPFKVDEVSR
ncbi:MAG: 50S ribosomal protein L5 [Candidatus Taylorbacteria bacterium RIFCSPLOWO2_01_FULL_45_15b]|uniref:Large ribosomal subunit protein uL5 n=1 Tax=Candidatus Taylorbacteria bacterium RIFCSPLOWO2_01_FULL_45_15b TaxID=1802319 RepID=A0A1G2N7Z1_9BACT|nr:MAG: 50S ribosomal protein L5 [Candidatus Taylorbacteria bacterium RIFCSPLOWO2_01_FULL_45_15b]